MTEIYGDFDDSDDLGDENDQEIEELGTILSWDDDEVEPALAAISSALTDASILPPFVQYNMSKSSVATPTAPFAVQAPAAQAYIQQQPQHVQHQQQQPQLQLFQQSQHQFLAAPGPAVPAPGTAVSTSTTQQSVSTRPSAAPPTATTAQAPTANDMQPQQQQQQVVQQQQQQQQQQVVQQQQIQYPAHYIAMLQQQVAGAAHGTALQIQAAPGGAPAVQATAPHTSQAGPTFVAAAPPAPGQAQGPATATFAYPCQFPNGTMYITTAPPGAPGTQSIQVTSQAQPAATRTAQAPTATRQTTVQAPAAPQAQQQQVASTTSILPAATDPNAPKTTFVTTTAPQPDPNAYLRQIQYSIQQPTTYAAAPRPIAAPQPIISAPAAMISKGNTITVKPSATNLVSSSDTDGEASKSGSKRKSSTATTLTSAALKASTSSLSASSSASAKLSKKELDTDNMTPAEKAKANRDRNREHARNTRLRKKAYLEKLKTTVDELCRERDTLVSERAGAASLLVEMHNTRTEVLMSFFALRSTYEKRRELWSSILDESCFVCAMPVTPYRSFPASEVQVSKSQRTILGIDGMMADTASLHLLLNTLIDRSRYPQPSPGVQFRYTLVTEDAVVAGNQMMARWVMSTINATQLGARMEVSKQGMLCCKFNSAHKIIGLELMFDVMAFMLQLKQASGSELFSVVPNTVQTCQRSFESPMVMTLAERPYTIVQVNRLWEIMTRYKAEDVVGKASCRILQGQDTSRDDLESLMSEVRYKRPASAMLLNYSRTGKRFRNFINVYPLSTDSKITHYVALTVHVDDLDGGGNVTHVIPSTQSVTSKAGSSAVNAVPAAGTVALPAQAGAVAAPAGTQVVVTSAPSKPMPIAPASLVAPSQPGGATILMTTAPDAGTLAAATTMAPLHRQAPPAAIPVQAAALHPSNTTGNPKQAPALYYVASTVRSRDSAGESAAKQARKSSSST